MTETKQDNQAETTASPDLGPVAHYVPTDPLFGDQGYLLASGTWTVDINITDVWDEYRGDGVIVGVVDDGVEWDHPDLIDNYDASISYDAVDGDSNADHDSDDLGHGTNVAGLIAADDNGIGTVGVAPDATLAGFRIGFDLDSPLSEIVEVFQRQVDVDISNNSWGFTYPFIDNFDTPLFQEIGDAVQNAAEVGRDGLGTIWVFAAGNGGDFGDRSDYYNLTNSRYTISVGALDRDGDTNLHSSPGSSVLISAPSAAGYTGAQTTTDRQGEAGISDGDYATDFGFTSGAAPLVSGVAALMLEANPDLGYRDVQEILVYSASSESTGYDGIGANVNGGSLRHHDDRGFGALDAHAAVRLAESWQKQSTSANEVSLGYSAFPNESFGYQNSVSSEISVSNSSIDLQWVEIDINLDHDWIGDLQIRLIHEVDGESSWSMLVDRPGQFDNNFGLPDQDINFTFASATHWGETADGIWRLVVSDHASGDSGRLHDWSIRFFGDEPSPDDDHIYTDDYAVHAGPQENGNFREQARERRSLEDTDGGVDRINAAAVTDDIVINLNDGRLGQIAGVDFTISAGTVIENVHAGDGDDRLFGNSAANSIVGARGNDLLIGGGGDDSLSGGSGRDLFVVRADNSQRILDFEVGIDALMITGAGAPAEGVDLASMAVEMADGIALDFGGGNLLHLDGLSLADLGLVEFSVFADDAFLAGDHRLSAVGENDRDTVEGTGEGDRLLGGHRLNTLNGYGGRDELHAYLDGGLLYGGYHNDTLTGQLRGGLYGGSGDDVLRLGVRYADLNDGKLFGGDGDDLLDAGDGEVSLYGGAGADVFRFDASDFAVTEVLYHRIYDFEYGVDRLDLSGIDVDFSDLIFLYSDTMIRVEYDENRRFLIYGNERELVESDFILRRSGGTDTAGDANDLIHGIDEDDRIHGLDGADTILGYLGSDMLFGEAGSDEVYGGWYDDTLFGGRSGDFLHGDEGRDHLFGQDGADSLFGGSDDDVLSGGEGDDLLSGGSGKDSLHGGAGNDTLVLGSGGGLVDGGEGDDTADFSFAEVALLSADGHSVTADGGLYHLIDIENLIGIAAPISDNPDIVRGTSGSDTLDGLGGSDSIKGLGGDDLLIGGDGEDTLIGGDGNDTLTGGSGADRLVFDSGFGADVVSDFENGVDLIDISSLGLDFIDLQISGGVVDVAGFGTIQLTGIADDQIAANDFLFDPNGTRPQPGPDDLAGTRSSDSLHGTDGAEAIFGYNGEDTIKGAEGNDTLYGGSDAGEVDLFIHRPGDGHDVISDFEAGVDLVLLVGLASDFDGLVISGTVDALIEFSVTDSIELRGVSPDALDASSFLGLADNQIDGNLVIGTGGEDNLYLATSNSDHFIGLGGNDTMDVYGGADLAEGVGGDDVLDGGGGNDTLRGGDGNDRLLGRGDDDLLEGGAGSDTVDAGAGNDSVYGGAGTDSVNGEGGEDGITGGDGEDSLHGGDGNDRLFGESDSDALTGGDGNDTIFGGDGSDSIDGDTGDDSLNGGDDNDTIYGGSGNDTIDGADGRDVVRGYDGDDVVHYGPVDQAYGDRGADRFYAQAADTWTNDSTASIIGGDSYDAVFGGNWDERIFDSELVFGGGGDDSIYGERSGWLYGGDGADTIYSGDRDIVFGGAGQNYLIANDYSQAFSIDSGSVRDFDTAEDKIVFLDRPIDFSEIEIFDQDGSAVVRVGENNSLTLLGLSADQIGEQQFLGITGVSAGEVTGTNLDDRISSGSSTQQILHVGDGNDMVTLNGGGDTAYGGAGDDFMDAHGVFGDEVYGGNGNDSIRTFGASAYVSGGAGDDAFRDFFGGRNTVDGGAGNDELVAGGGSDLLYGGAGADVVQALSGYDTLYGGDGADCLEGGGWEDTLFGGQGADSLYGGAGDDLINAGAGGGLLDGGDGFDTADFSFAAYAVLSADRNVVIADGQSFTVVDIESFTGLNDPISDAADTLSGTSGNDTIDALGGDDSVDGLGGDDSLLGNDGNDTLTGGAGVDSLLGGAGDDVLNPGLGGGLVDGGEGVDTADFSFAADAVFDPFTGEVTAGGLTWQVEGIENLTGVTYAIDDTANTVTGTDGADTIDALGGNDTVDAGAGPDDVTGGAGDDVLIGGFGYDTLTGGAGNDSLSGGAGVDLAVFAGALSNFEILRAGDGLSFTVTDTVGGEGSDTVDADIELVRFGSWTGRLESAGDGSNRLVLGGTGDETLSGEGGNDSMTGGAGDDWLSASDGQDTLDGGDGIDTADYSTAQEAIFINLFGGGGHGGDLLIDIENIDGSASADTVYGGSGGNRLRGHDGWDIILGRGGADELDGGVGRDSLYGQDDNDTLYGGGDVDYLRGDAGDDRIWGGAVLDYIYGGGGADGLFGGEGNDRIQGGEGNDTIDGGDDRDLIYAEGGDDLVQGGAGNDLLRGGAGNDTLDGGAGGNRLEGGDGDDLATGGEGIDVITGGAGSDTLSGLAGNDRIYGEAGTDSIDGGLGADRLDGGLDNDTISGGDGDDVVLGRDGNDSLSGGGGDDDVFGMDGDDVLDGGLGRDRADGGTGNDLITGGDGADTLIGRAGVDTLNGDGGDDIVYAGGDADLVDGGDGNDRLVGEGGNDTIGGGTGNDVLEGRDGDDRLDGWTGDDRLYGGEGADTLIGRDGADRLWGHDGNDLIYGGDGDDDITGGAGHDRLVAEAGNDWLEGGVGDDTLEGRAGNDTLTGGAGADEFRFFSGDGADSADVIRDFETGVDSFRLYSLTITGLAEIDTSGEGIPDATRVGFDNGSTVDLLGITGIDESDLF